MRERRETVARWLGPWRLNFGYWCRPAVSVLDGERVWILGPAPPTARREAEE